MHQQHVWISEGGRAKQVTNSVPVKVMKRVTRTREEPRLVPYVATKVIQDRYLYVQANMTGKPLLELESHDFVYEDESRVADETHDERIVGTDLGPDPLDLPSRADWHVLQNARLGERLRAWLIERWQTAYCGDVLSVEQSLRCLWGSKHDGGPPGADSRVQDRFGLPWNVLRDRMLR